MNRNAALPVAPEAQTRAQLRARRIFTILIAGTVLVMLAPLYAWLAINYSGRLALAQTASADQAARGFDFGPVYMNEGQPGRYYIDAVLPEVDGGVWQTHFEVLDAQKLPVFRQDELRFIGDYMFQAGQRDRTAKEFTLDRATGYYYFRFVADNGVYHTKAGDPPVVSFAVRQGVLSGTALWGPAGGMLALGLLLLGLGIAAVRRVGSASRPPRRERPRRGGEPAPADESPLAARLRRRQSLPPGVQPR